MNVVKVETKDLGQLYALLPLPFDIVDTVRHHDVASTTTAANAKRSLHLWSAQDSADALSAARSATLAGSFPRRAHAAISRNP